MGNKNTAKFDADTGHPWDDVMNVADELFEELHKKNYSSQDIAHIGLRLTHLGNFAWIIEGTEHVNKKFPGGLLNAKVLFGLKQQGLLPTVEKMLIENNSWEEIGKVIGWDPDTLKEHYRWIKGTTKN